MSLPSGYKRLEYIQSSGTQYINTGHSFTSNNGRVIAKLQYTASPDGVSAFGSTPAPGTPWSIIMYGTKPDFYVAGSILNMGFGSVSVGTDYTVDCTADNGSFTVVWNDITYQNTYSGTIVGTGTFAIFCHLNGSNAIQQCSMKLYSCQIYDNGTLIRDYIPCINASGEVGLYDIVGKQFYGNAGTGTFTAGPEVVVSTPANFRLSSSTENSATLAWDAVDGATGYKLYRDGVLIATLTDTSYTDTIQPFTSYIYTLTAYNDSGESDPATIYVQVIIQPETPSNFRVSSASMAAISLAWDTVTGAESYQLSRDGVVIYTGEYPIYTDSGLTAETAYTYTLSEVNSAGSSAETTLEATTTQLILVTDRTAADVAAQNAKGTYNAEDLNRVGAAMNYVADRLRAAGYDPHISPKTDWNDEDWVDQAAQAVYLGDLAELRKQFSMMKSTPEVPPRILATGINTNDGLTHTWANDIERILEDVDALITSITAGWFYSGELYAGEV